MRNANLLLYLNLAGEVFYIIVHRMKSQKVKEEHQERVRNDIAVAICHTTVVQNLLKGSLQILNLKMTDVRILMDRIVHSSIMTVNSFSMEKLFELTLIATKYQYTTCQYPSDILLVALNHLDTIRKTVTDTTAKLLAENLHNLLVDRFKDVDSRTMQTYRYLVLSYLADVKLKMTNLIRLGYQKTTGEFVKQFPDRVRRTELRPSGLIEVFKCAEQDEEIDVSCKHSCESFCDCDNFDDEETLRILACEKKSSQIHETASRGAEVLSTRFKPAEVMDLIVNTPPLRPSLALNGNRGIVLGLSIYDIPGNCDDAPLAERENPCGESTENEEPTSEGEGNVIEVENSDLDRHYFLANSDFYATKGLDLCSVLLGCDPNTNDDAAKPSTNASDITFQQVSASALGLEGVLDFYSSLEKSGESFAQEKGANCEETSEQIKMNPNAINVVEFDARADSTDSKAALVAIAQDFFEIEAEEKDINSQRSKYSSTIDDLLNDFDFNDDKNDG